MVAIVGARKHAGVVICSSSRNQPGAVGENSECADFISVDRHRRLPPCADRFGVTREGSGIESLQGGNGGFAAGSRADFHGAWTKTTNLTGVGVYLCDAPITTRPRDATKLD